MLIHNGSVKEQSRVIIHTEISHSPGVFVIFSDEIIVLLSPLPFSPSLLSDFLFLSSPMSSLAWRLDCVVSAGSTLAVSLAAVPCGEPWRWEADRLGLPAERLPRDSVFRGLAGSARALSTARILRAMQILGRGCSVTPVDQPVQGSSGGGNPLDGDQRWKKSPNLLFSVQVRTGKCYVLAQ